jgi:hypothetical protein
LSEHNNVATWEEITSLREEYEELRSLIDDGHEAMTHADAVKELAGMRAENKRLHNDCSIMAAGMCIYPESLDPVSDHDTILCAADKMKRLVRKLQADSNRYQKIKKMNMAQFVYMLSHVHRVDAEHSLDQLIDNYPKMPDP